MKKNIVTITPTIEKNDNLFTVYPATEFIPDWYRTSPSNNPLTKTNLDINTGIVTTTYKMCTPFQDAMTAGYIVCTSADIEVSNIENGKKIFLWKTNRLLVSQHISWQVTGLPIPEGYLDVPYKFINEFKINTPKGVSMLFINPINRYDLPFLSIGGVIDTDKYDQDINFPFLIKSNFTGIIPKGTPIIQMIPFERKMWNRQYRKFNLIERQNNLDTLNSIIRRAYKNIYWVRKEYK
jgi:hypothetical protein